MACWDRGERLLTGDGGFPQRRCATGHKKKKKVLGGGAPPYKNRGGERGAMVQRGGKGGVRKGKKTLNW